MKRLLTYLLLCGALLGSACTKDGSAAGGEGSVSFRIDVEGGTRAYDPMQTLMIRIFNADGGLIRRYKSLDEMPASLSLVAGEYRITVDAGDRSEATWTNKTYFGEQNFTVEANKSTTEQVVCPTVNVGAAVTIDATVTARFDKEVKVVVSACNELPEEGAATGPALEFSAETNEATGYFLLPEGVTNLCWQLTGDGENGEIEKTGVIENAERAMIYKLKFQYSKTPDGFADITVTVDKSIDKHYDDIGFSPQPTIKGENCSIAQPVGFVKEDLTFIVSSIKDLETVTMTAKGTDYTLFDATAGATAPEGTSCEVLDSRKLRITLAASFFENYAAGVYPVEFRMTDNEDGKGSGRLTLAVPGMPELTPADYDLWSNSARLMAIVTDPTAKDIQFAYRYDGGEWRCLPTEKNAFTYTAEIAPKWRESTNDKGMPVYSLDSSEGLFAGRNYEYKLTDAGADISPVCTLSTAGAAQTIPYGDMEDSGLSCFSTSNASAPAWGSGNNSFTTNLCAQSTYNGMEGSKCAKLSASNPIGSILASGNLFTGCFDRPGGAFSTTGYVYFGQPYAWTARPAAFHVKYYAETLGKADVDSNYGAPLKKGDQDKARIFAAIVDWNGRHTVTSGGSSPEGTWDPAQQNSTGEGRIIAYGSLFIDEQSSGGTMIDAEIPLQYYDRTAAKPSGNYTLVISCSTSAYGDFMVGCKSNVLYIDDFRWGY